MKKIALALLLLLPTAVVAEKAPPNPANYPVMVHVIGSQGSGSSFDQRLDAIIDGKQVELHGISRGTLALGDYRAQAKAGVNPPKKLNGYDIYQSYEFLFPDGTTRNYEVVGFGTPAPACTSANP